MPGCSPPPLPLLHRHGLAAAREQRRQHHQLQRRALLHLRIHGLHVDLRPPGAAAFACERKGGPVSHACFRGTALQAYIEERSIFIRERVNGGYSVRRVFVQLLQMLATLSGGPCRSAPTSSLTRSLRSPSSFSSRSRPPFRSTFSSTSRLTTALPISSISVWERAERALWGTPRSHRPRHPPRCVQLSSFSSYVEASPSSLWTLLYLTLYTLHAVALRRGRHCCPDRGRHPHLHRRHRRYGTVCCEFRGIINPLLAAPPLCFCAAGAFTFGGWVPAH